MSIMEKDAAYVAGTYKRFPVEIVSGKGSIVTDVNGKQYIDMGSGIGVTSFGIADDIWQQAIIDQIGKVQHMSNLYYTQPCADLAEMLCARTGMSKVFFSNSGAESNECAIKAARKFACDTKGPEYYNIITLVNSFHGRTLTTLAATGQDHYHELFQPLTPGFLYAHSGDAEELEQLVKSNKVAAIMMECIQGEGGVIPVNADYVQAVARIAKENDVLLIVDEVQTGNGRTGELYAYMNFGLKPNIVSTAKGLAGGLPIGATMLDEKVKNVFGYGDHGTTFGGNPVSCAAALSIIPRIDDALLAEVKAKGAWLFDTFNGCDAIESVSGMGLMIGVKSKSKTAAEVVAACMEKGVLCLTAKDKVRLMPALNIPMETLKQAAEIIMSCC